MGALLTLLHGIHLGVHGIDDNSKNGNSKSM